MIRLSGLVPNKDIAIQFSGLRSGEKMYEELLITNSEIKTDNAKIFKANESFIAQVDLNPIIEKMEEYIRNYDSEGILKILSENVEGFNR